MSQFEIDSVTDTADRTGEGIRPESYMTYVRYASAAGCSAGDLLMFDTWQTVALSVTVGATSGGSNISIWNVVIDAPGGAAQLRGGFYCIATEAAAQDDMIPVLVRGQYVGANVHSSGIDGSILVPTSSTEIAISGSGTVGRKRLGLLLDDASSTIIFDGWNGFAVHAQ